MRHTFIGKGEVIADKLTLCQAVDNLVVSI